MNGADGGGDEFDTRPPAASERSDTTCPRAPTSDQRFGRSWQPGPAAMMSASSLQMRRSAHRSPDMLHYAVVFFVIAIIAAVLGFGGIAAGAAGIAKILFVVFLIGAIITFLVGRSRV